MYLVKEDMNINLCNKYIYICIWMYLYMYLGGNHEATHMYMYTGVQLMGDVSEE